MSDARRTAEAYADVDPEKFGARPQRRTRPRTKDRPDYSAAEIARVLTVEHRLYPLSLRLIAEGKAKVVGESVEIAPDAVDETARLFSAA